LHEKTDHGLVAQLPPVRPGRTRKQHPGREQGGADQEAQRQEGHRLGMRQAQLGADEARAPQQDEDRRDEMGRGHAADMRELETRESCGKLTGRSDDG
jgi:hypothetical protein